MDALSQSRLSEVMPVLQDKIHELATVLKPQGIELEVIEGLRSWQESDVLFQEGRTLRNGLWVITDVRKVVTNARGGQSWHNYGLAVDVAPEVIDGRIDWNGSHYQWVAMEKEARVLGLTCGADFKRLIDCPHAQLSGRFPISPDDEVRQIFRNQGMTTVWDEVLKSS
jgi:peptidoglycan L-alanyl-D-glutamate endopeptidase CwlK